MPFTLARATNSALGGYTLGSAISRIVSECDYGTAVNLASAQAVEYGGGFFDRVGGDVRAEWSRRSHFEDGVEFLPGTEITAPDLDAFHDGIDQRQLVGVHGNADQHHRALPLHAAKCLLDCDRRRREDDRRVDTAPLLLQAAAGGFGVLDEVGTGVARLFQLVLGD